MVPYDHQVLLLRILSDVSFSSSDQFLPRHLLINAHLNSTWDLSADLCSSVSLQFPSLSYSALEILAILVSLNSWLCFFNLENLLVSTRIPSPCTLSWKPSQGSKLRQPWGSLPLYSVFQEFLFFIAWNLMSCKAVVSIYFIGFCLFQSRA